MKGGTNLNKATGETGLDRTQRSYELFVTVKEHYQLSVVGFNLLINNPQTKRRKGVHQTWRCHKTRSNCKYCTGWIELEMSTANWETKSESNRVKFNKENQLGEF